MARLCIYCGQPTRLFKSRHADCERRALAAERGDREAKEAQEMQARLASESRLPEVPGRCCYCGKPTGLLATFHFDCESKWFAAHRDQVQQEARDGAAALEAVRNDIRQRRGEELTASRGVTMTRVNGIGTCLYGSTDEDPATGTYVATYWFTFVFIPLIPLGRYRVTNGGGNRYLFLGKVPSRWTDWFQPVGWWAAVILLFQACGT